MNAKAPIVLIAHLAHKELREILRDRRTIITLVLMPVLLYPLLTIAFQQYLVMSSPPKGVTPRCIVGFATFAEGQRFLRFMELVKGTDEITWDPRETSSVAEDVRTGNVDLGVSIAHSDELLNPVDPTQTFACTIMVREDSAIGLKAAEIIKDRMNDVNLWILNERLRVRGVRQPTLPVPVQTEVITAVEGKKSSPLASVIPLILVLMTITGAVYPAIDLTAGERERGTLEVLMAAPIPRIGVLLAKYIAVLTVAMLTGLVNLTMMMVTIATSGLKALVFESGLNVGVVAALFGLLLLFAMFFSAVLLAVTSFARSFKEAQAYLIPLMLLALAPGMLSLMDVQLTGFLKVAPLVNVVLLAREILRGGVPWGDALIVVGSTLGYAAAAIGVASRIFGAEAVLYSEQGQLADLFRRPRGLQRAASGSTALMSVAILFPLTVILGGGLAQISIDPTLRLVVGAVATIALFAGIPVALSWHGRIQMAEAFRVRGASPVALIGVALLGLSLFPLVAQLIAWENAVGFSSLPQTLENRLHELTNERLSISPLAVLAALAVVPALVEEIFFRGWLFSAWERSLRPWQVILITGGVFGLFHVVTGGIVLVERLLPSAVLGIILGWVRGRTGSIVTGIILHMIYNGLVTSVSIFPGTFAPLAEAVNALGAVPPAWLFGALGFAMCGAILVWWSGRNAPA